MLLDDTIKDTWTGVLAGVRKLERTLAANTVTEAMRQARKREAREIIKQLRRELALVEGGLR